MKTLLATEDTDNVLRLLRKLPPRERLRVVAEVLPELEDQLPATPASPAFWQGPDIQALAERQDVQPIADFDNLLGGWPEDESINDFLAALSGWRQESLWIRPEINDHAHRRYRRRVLSAQGRHACPPVPSSFAGQYVGAILHDGGRIISVGICPQLGQPEAH